MEFNPFSVEFFDDPYPVYRWLRDEQPVYHNERLGFWALSRFDDVAAAHRDWKTFSSAYGVTLEQLRAGRRDATGSIITIDPPEHDRMRKLVSRAFTPRAVESLEPLVREVVRSYLEPLAEREEFDAVADFAAPFPVEVISAVLGVPEGDRQQVRVWTDAMLHRESDRLESTAEGQQAAIDSWRYFRDLVRDKRRHPDGAMTAQLCEADVVDEDGTTHRLTDDEIAGFATLLAAAGSETVTKLVANGVVEFRRHPDQWQLVLDDAAPLPNAVEELLRYLPPSQYQGRFSTSAATFEGGTIPAAQPVLLLTGAATRDPKAYEDPDRLDVTRSPQLALGFGHGIHACLGAALARVEGRVAFDEWRRRWPRYDVSEAGLRRVHMSNVAGFSNVPVSVGS